MTHNPDQMIRTFLSMRYRRFDFLCFEVFLAKAKEDLEAEKRDLVRSLERRGLDMENLNGDHG